MRRITQSQLELLSHCHAIYQISKRQCNEHTKARNPIRALWLSMPVLHRGTPQISWFQQPVHSRGSKRSLQTRTLCKHPALCTFHLVVVTTSPMESTLQPYFSVYVTVISTQLSIVSYSRIRSPPDLKKSSEKLNFTYKAIYFLSNCFAYCRFSNMNILSLFNQQVNWPFSLNKMIIRLRPKETTGQNYLKNISGMLINFCGFHCSTSFLQLYCPWKKWCVTKLDNILCVIG